MLGTKITKVAKTRHHDDIGGGGGLRRVKGEG